jgi:hypothetical protein
MRLQLLPPLQALWALLVCQQKEVLLLLLLVLVMM